MEIKSDIKLLLQSHFKQAYQGYLDYLKSKPDENSYFFITGEDLNEDEFIKIREYFLQEVGVKRLSLSEFNFGTKSTPPTTDEQLFSRGYESLLKWAAYTQHYRRSTSIEKIVEEFEEKIGTPAKKVTYVLLFGMHREKNFYDTKLFDLSEEVKFGLLNSVETQMIRDELQRSGSHSQGPNPVRVMPDFVLRIENPVGTEADGRKISSIIQNFRVFLWAMFGVDVEIPYSFNGIETPMSPWVYYSGGLPEKFENFKLYRDVGQNEFNIFAKYWNELNPTILDKYTVTGSRLSLVKKRGWRSWTDVVVDLSIALEGLFEEEVELKFRYSIVFASILGTNFQEKKEIYEKIKDFYDLRSVIVHGSKLERKKALKRKFETMTKEQFDLEAKYIKNLIIKLLRILILNNNLRQSPGQIDHILGSGIPIILEPTYP